MHGTPKCKCCLCWKGGHQFNGPENPIKETLLQSYGARWEYLRPARTECCLDNIFTRNGLACTTAKKVP